MIREKATCYFAMKTALRLAARARSIIEARILIWTLGALLITLGGFNAAGISFGGSDLKMWLVDLHVYSPVRGYSMKGQILTRQVQSVCASRIKQLDVSTAGVLQRETNRLDGVPILVSRKFDGSEIGRFPPSGIDVRELRLSPSGRAVAAAGEPWPDAKRCNAGVFVARAGSRAWDLVWCDPSNTSPPDSVSWSPDEKKLAFSHQGQVLVMGGAGDGLRFMVRGRFARWSPDGERISLVDGEDVQIIRWQEPAVIEHRLRVPGLISDGTEWSPDGRYLSVVRRSEDQPGDSRTRTELAFIEVATWKVIGSPIRGWGSAAGLRWAPLSLESIDSLVRTRESGCTGQAAK